MKSPNSRDEREAVVKRVRDARAIAIADRLARRMGARFIAYQTKDHPHDL